MAMHLYVFNSGYFVQRDGEPTKIDRNSVGDELVTIVKVDDAGNFWCWSADERYWVQARPGKIENAEYFAATVED